MEASGRLNLRTRRAFELRVDQAAEDVVGLGADDLLGLRPSVASRADLAWMLSALGRQEDDSRLPAIRRLVELDRGWTIER
jgi:hypothetical protein